MQFKAAATVESDRSPQVSVHRDRHCSVHATTEPSMACRMRHLLSIAAIAVSLASPASAGWEWTQWGMTTHAVRLAGPAGLGRLDAPLARSRLRMLFTVDVTMDGLDLSARLGFGRSGRLGLIELRPVDPAQGCVSASAVLARRYGRPVSQRFAPSERLLWADAGEGNLIEYRRSEEGGCVIRLTPLPRRQPYLGG